MGVECPGPPVRNDVVTPRHLLNTELVKVRNGNYVKTDPKAWKNRVVFDRHIDGETGMRSKVYAMKHAKICF